MSTLRERQLICTIYLPAAVFFSIGKPLSGLAALVLQLTILLWVPASLWSIKALQAHDMARMIAKARAERE